MVAKAKKPTDASVNGKNVEAEVMEELDDLRELDALQPESPIAEPGKKKRGRPPGSKNSAKPKYQTSVKFSEKMVNVLADMPFQLDALIESKFFNKVPVWPQDIHAMARDAMREWVGTFTLNIHPAWVYFAAVTLAITMAKRMSLEDAMKYAATMQGNGVKPPEKPADGKQSEAGFAAGAEPGSHAAPSA